MLDNRIAILQTGSLQQQQQQKKKRVEFGQLFIFFTLAHLTDVLAKLVLDN